MGHAIKRPRDHTKRSSQMGMVEKMGCPKNEQTTKVKRIKKEHSCSPKLWSLTFFFEAKTFSFGAAESGLGITLSSFGRMAAFMGCRQCGCLFEQGTKRGMRNAWNMSKLLAEEQQLATAASVECFEDGAVEICHEQWMERKIWCNYGVCSP